MVQATNPSTTSRSRSHSAFQALAYMLGLVEAVLTETGQTTPDPKAWRVTRDGDVILPNRKIELRARSSGRRAVAVA